MAHERFVKMKLRDMLPIAKSWFSFLIQTMEELSTQSKLTVRRCKDLMAILHQEVINEGMLIARNIKFTANPPN